MYNLKKEYLRNRVKYINFLEAYIHLRLVTRALMMRRIRHVKESRQKDTMINWTSRSNGNMKYSTLLLLTKTHARVQTSLIELLCNRKRKLLLDNSSKNGLFFYVASSLRMIWNLLNAFTISLNLLLMKNIYYGSNILKILYILLIWFVNLLFYYMALRQRQIDREGFIFIFTG